MLICIGSLQHRGCIWDLPKLGNHACLQTRQLQKSHYQSTEGWKGKQVKHLAYMISFIGVLWLAAVSTTIPAHIIKVHVQLITHACDCHKLFRMPSLVLCPVARALGPFTHDTEEECSSPCEGWWSLSTCSMLRHVTSFYGSEANFKRHSIISLYCKSASKLLYTPHLRTMHRCSRAWAGVQYSTSITWKKSIVCVIVGSSSKITCWTINNEGYTQTWQQFYFK